MTSLTKVGRSHTPQSTTSHFSKGHLRKHQGDVGRPCQTSELVGFFEVSEQLHCASMFDQGIPRILRTLYSQTAKLKQQKRRFQAVIGG